MHGHDRKPMGVSTPPTNWDECKTLDEVYSLLIKGSEDECVVSQTSAYEALQKVWALAQPVADVRGMVEAHDALLAAKLYLTTPKGCQNMIDKGSVLAKVTAALASARHAMGGDGANDNKAKTAAA